MSAKQFFSFLKCLLNPQARWQRSPESPKWTVPFALLSLAQQHPHSQQEVIENNQTWKDGEKSSLNLQPDFSGSVGGGRGGGRDFSNYKESAWDTKPKLSVRKRVQNYHPTALHMYQQMEAKKRCQGDTGLRVLLPKVQIASLPINQPPLRTGSRKTTFPMLLFVLLRFNDDIMPFSSLSV